MRRAVILSCFAAVVLSGCAQEESGKRAEPDIEKIPVVKEVDLGKLSTPLDAYWPKESEYLAIRQAEVKLSNQCLRNLGYSRNPLPAAHTAEVGTDHSELLHRSEEQVARYGYNKSRSETVKELEARPGQKWDKAAEKTQLDLMSGEIREFGGARVPEGGCSGSTNRILTEGAEPPRTVTSENGAQMKALPGTAVSPLSSIEALLGSLQYDAVSYTLQDSRVRAMEEKWSSCMDEKGFAYDTPRDALRDERWRETEKATPQEIATATADVACREKVNYLGTMITVRNAYEQNIIERRAEELTRLDDAVEVWLRNAHEALEG